MFLPESGGSFAISTGAAPQSSATHITSLPMRARLLHVTGDGSALNFGFEGEGEVVLELGADAVDFECTGADSMVRDGNRVRLTFDNDGYHEATVSEPTAVDLAAFTAAAFESGVRIDWETTSEVNTAGFNLYRAESPAGERSKLNAALIRSDQPPGSTLGASYSWLDTGLVAGRTYYYRLEDVQVTGAATLHGPVPAQVPVVPEASTWVLMVSGASTLAGYVGLQVRARRKTR